ncbi:MAG: hypothetical protein EON47_18285, partial [Acetobacteraceae bacterium]
MSLDLALTIARSGLASIQRNLAQTAQNIANAETPGYTRKTVPQQALVAGDMPLGLRNTDAQRAVDTAVLAQLDQSRGAVAAATVREALLQGIEQAHGAAGDGATLGDAVAALGDAFTLLRAAPAGSDLIWMVSAAMSRSAALAEATSATMPSCARCRAVPIAFETSWSRVVTVVAAT